MPDSTTSNHQTALLAGSTVRPGFYFSLRRLDIVAVGKHEDVLPGVEGERYLRLHTVAALLLAPLLGAVFVALAPLVRVGLLGQQLGRRWRPLAGGVARKLSGLIPARKSKGG